MAIQYTFDSGQFPKVMTYKAGVQQALTPYSLLNFTDLILMIIAQESGGFNRDDWDYDIMQSSESAGLPPGTLHGQASIDQGCKHFNDCMEAIGIKGTDYTEPQIRAVIQGYNYGTGYCRWVKRVNNGEWTQANANQFADMQGGRYGDRLYVEHVEAKGTKAPGGLDSGVGGAIKYIYKNGQNLIAGGAFFPRASTAVWIANQPITSGGGGGIGGGAFVSEVQKKVVELMYSILNKNSYTQSAGLREQVFNGYGDCSSTCWKIYEKVGIYVGTWTGDQIYKGNTIDTTQTMPTEANLQLGDLLFFGTSHGSKGSVKHVEMYTGTNEICGHGGGTGPTKKDMSNYCNSASTWGQTYICANRYV